MPAQAIVIHPIDSHVAPICGSDYDMLNRCASTIKAANDVALFETIHGHSAQFALPEVFNSPFIYDDGKHYAPGYEYLRMRPYRLNADEVAFLDAFQGNKGNWGEQIAFFASIPNLRWVEIGNDTVTVAFAAAK